MRFIRFWKSRSVKARQARRKLLFRLELYKNYYNGGSMSFTTVIDSIGHGFAIAYHDVATFFKGVATKGPTVADTIGKDVAAMAPVANVILGDVDPAFLPMARGAEAILGEVFAAIHSAGDAATQSGVVVNIGSELVAGVKDFVDLLSNHPAVKAAQTPPTGS